MHIRSLNLHRHFFPCVDRTCPPDSENTTMSPRPEPIFHPHVGLRTSHQFTTNFQNGNYGSSSFSQIRARRCAQRLVSYMGTSYSIHENLSQPYLLFKGAKQFRNSSCKILRHRPFFPKKKTKIHALNKSAIPNTANRRKRPLAICFDRLGTG